MGDVNASGVLELVKHAEMQAVQRNVAPVLVPLNDGDGSALVFDTLARKVLDSGEIDKAIKPKVPPRTVTALTFESFVEAVKDFRPRPSKADAERKGSIDPAPFKAMVYVSPGLIAARFHDLDKSEGVLMELRLSGTWKSLRRLAGLKPEYDANAEGDFPIRFTQTEMRDLLRCELDAATDPPDLVKLVSKVKFSSATGGEAVTDTGKFALSRSTTAEITGASDLPETVTLTAPMWETLADTIDHSKVRCVFDASPVDQLFTMRPRAGEIERCERACLVWLVNKLKGMLGEGVAVYAGVW